MAGRWHFEPGASTTRLLCRDVTCCWTTALVNGRGAAGSDSSYRTRRARSGLSPRGFECDLRAVSGLNLRDLAARSCGLNPHWLQFGKVRTAAVPVSSGQGAIPFFSQCIEVILRHLGCDAFVTQQPDVKGIQEAATSGAEIVFLADDDRFVALNIRSGACADDDPCTANGYVTALEAAAGGLSLRSVAVLHLGRSGERPPDGLSSSAPQWWRSSRMCSGPPPPPATTHCGSSRCPRLWRSQTISSTRRRRPT